MTLYKHLSDNERQQIECFLTNNLSIPQIANKLTRACETIRREIKNNPNYNWQAAAQCAKQKRFYGRSKINPQLAKHIKSKLQDKWSPEQIAGRLGNISHPTIYKYIYTNTELAKLLPNYHRRWIYRNLKQVNEMRRNLPSVHDRNDTNEPQSWEADLVRFGKNCANITTLFNRKSKLVRLIKNMDGRAITVLSNLKKHSSEIKMLCMDRGPEFIRPAWFIENKIQAYYCDAMSPGQKGGVENTNRRLRRWLPCAPDIVSISQGEIDKIARKMNNTPRKTLGYLTPKEAHTQMTRFKL